MERENGEEKLIAVARHIAKTLGHNESMADDIVQIFSTFDGRFSRDKFNAPASDDNLHRRISRYLSYDRPIWSDSADSSAFLDAVDELLSRPSPDASDLTSQVMFRLADELRFLMERGGMSFESAAGDLSEDDEEEEGEEEEDGEIPVAQPLTDYDVVIDALPAGTVGELNEIARRMVAAGFGKDCAHAYGASRREFLAESASRLGLVAGDDVHRMAGQDLEEHVDRWIKASPVVLRILFPSERRLCDRIFSGFPAAADFSFMEVCRPLALHVLGFSDAVAGGSRAPERLFKLLDLLEAVRDLIMEFEANFSDQYSVFLRNEAVEVLKRLGEAVQGVFMELENRIRRDPAKSPVPRGGLHPITRYVMNYIRAACRSVETLDQVFEDGGTSLAVQLVWIMDLLESNLEIKADIYNDRALRSIFLINNGSYIAYKAADGELGLLLGDDWLRKHQAKIKQLLSAYLKSSWNKLVNVLKAEDNAAVGKPGSIKETMKLFSSRFEEICRTQSQWVVSDEQLRKELRLSVARLVVPTYENFLGRFHNAPDVGKHADRYIKFGVEDVEIKINELFQGGGGLSSGGRS